MIPANSRFWLFLGALFVFVRTLPAQTHRVSVEVQVTDPDGRAVPDATVTLGLARYAQGNDLIVKAKTREDGIAEVEGEALFDYSITVTKSGFYPTRNPPTVLVSPEQIQRVTTSTQHSKVKLWPIRHPVAMQWGGSGMVTVKFPKTDAPAEFDLMSGDWVAPWGKGRIADVEFRVTGTYASRNDFDKTLTMHFLAPQCGFVPIEAPAHSGSELKFPYEAPADGYGSDHSWRFQRSAQKTHLDYGNSRRYIMRLRSKLGPDGMVESAIYGFIWEDLKFDVGPNGTEMMFDYAINPTGNRDIEIDLKKSSHL